MNKSVKALALHICLAVLIAGSLGACSLFKRRAPLKPDPVAAKSALDSALSRLSIQELFQAALVFRVAFDKANDSWHGADDDAVHGCKITGKEAEAALSALAPWMDKRARDEAERLENAPKSYRPPADAETCDRDCSCALGIRIFEFAKLDDQPHARVKDLKRMRTRFEAQSELLTGDRAEICAEAATWICQSDVLKALKGVQ